MSYGCSTGWTCVLGLIVLVPLVLVETTSNGAAPELSQEARVAD